MKNHNRSITLISVVFAALLAGSATHAQSEEKAEPSLYERLGGAYNIAAVVDDFIDRLLVNDTLNANPVVDKARNPARTPGLKFHVTAMVCWATGGPEKYTGLSMKDTHRHMNITESEWQAMAVDFKKTLDKFEVPEKEQSELFAIIESTKPDIVISEE